MAQFIGFECDSCGKGHHRRPQQGSPVRGSCRARRVQRGPLPECAVVPNAAEPRPLRRRRTKKEIEADARRDTPDSQVFLSKESL